MSKYFENFITNAKKEAKQSPNTPIVFNVQHNLTIRITYNKETDTFSFEKLSWTQTTEENILL